MTPITEYFRPINLTFYSVSTAVFMQINAKTVMANTVAINSTKVKTTGNSN